MLLAGDKSQNRTNNAYAQDNETTWPTGWAFPLEGGPCATRKLIAMRNPPILYQKP